MEKPKSSTLRKKKSEMSKQVRPKLSAEDDERFSHISQNPVFRRVPKDKKRVNIDSRFGAMFKDEQFKLKYKVDKRGKPMNLSTDENLKRYYNLVEDESSDDNLDDIKQENSIGDNDDRVKQEHSIDGNDDEVKQENSEESSVKEEDKTDIKEESIDSESEDITPSIPEKIKMKLKDLTIDYARGEGVLNSGSEDSDSDSEESSSADEESTSDDEGIEDMNHAWGELDKDAPRTDEITHRLALCNMDWDRIKSEDLMILFSSFLPPGGVLKYVAIYTSEFGKERLKEEDLYGPKELREYANDSNDLAASVPNNDSDVEQESDDDDENENSLNINYEDDNEEGSDFHMERLRKYQLNRLKYYYAVLEFDSEQTANTIYTECDGLEFESSATRIDLRFIPNDLTFDEEPRDKCDALPSTEKYIPKFFTTTALQQMKVDLTWDETDPQRQQLTQRVYDPKEKVDDDDLRAYLASSSDEDECFEKTENNIANSDEETRSNVDPISKYRGLLESIQEEEKKKKEKDVEMEITWGVGLKKTTESLVKKKLEEDNVKKMTPWEEMLAKKHEKKKEKKKLGKGQPKVEENEDDKSNSEDDQPFSDDDVEVDLDDPFFKDELGSNNKKSKKKSKIGDTKKQKAKEKTEDAAALELLLMDNDTNEKKGHFSLKKILENEKTADKKSKKKKRNKKKNLDDDKVDQSSTTKDDFQIDLSDDRFNALYTSHVFNLDPSDPNYKNTKSMGAIISEKQKRREKFSKSDKAQNQNSVNSLPVNNTFAEQEVKDESPIPSKIAKKTEIASLVKSIKRSTENMKQRKSKFGKIRY